MGLHPRLPRADCFDAPIYSPPRTLRLPSVIKKLGQNVKANWKKRHRVSATNEEKKGDGFVRGSGGGAPPTPHPPEPCSLA